MQSSPTPPEGRSPLNSRGGSVRFVRGSSMRRSPGSNRAGRPFSVSLDLGVLQTGYLEKLSSSAMGIGRGPRKRRFLVLTNTNLHWYKRDARSELFGEELGSVALKDVARVGSVDEVSFELVTSSDRRRRVFKAEDRTERDMWVDAITEASREQGGLGMALSSKGTEQGAAAMDAPPAAGSPSIFSIDDEVPRVEIVTVKDGRQHEVVAAHQVEYGAPVALPPSMSAGHVVTLKLSSGMRVELTGEQLNDELARATSAEPMRLMVEGGEAELLLRVGRHKEAASLQRRWYRDPEVAKTTAVVLVALYSVNLLSLALLAYGAWCMVETLRRHKSALPPIEIVIESYQEVIDLAAAERARKAREIPLKFIEGCGGDMVEARRRWDITRTWREEFDIDSLLDQPHPHFDTIKRLWPHYFLPDDREGDPVYLERTGEFKMPAMLQAGVSIDDLLHHCVYETEFLYQHLFQDINRNRLITVFDLAGANLSDLTGEAKVFLRKVLTFLQQHYPERSKVIIITNAPAWFSIVWRLLRPLLNEQTVRKIRIAASGAETYKALTEFIDPESIPVEYGGKLKYGDQPDSSRWLNPKELAFKKHVHEVNGRFPGPKVPPKVC